MSGKDRQKYASWSNNQQNAWERVNKLYASGKDGHQYASRKDKQQHASGRDRQQYASSRYMQVEGIGSNMQGEDGQHYASGWDALK